MLVPPRSDKMLAAVAKALAELESTVTLIHELVLRSYNGNLAREELEALLDRPDTFPIPSDEISAGVRCGEASR